MEPSSKVSNAAYRRGSVRSIDWEDWTLVRTLGPLALERLAKNSSAFMNRIGSDKPAMMPKYALTLSVDLIYERLGGLGSV